MTGRMPRVVIHSDGGAQPNPGVGAWAAVLRHSKGSKELFGGELGTTNNRMELTAAIQALEALTKPCVVEFHTDSEYVRNGITTWIKGWKKRGWKRGTKPVKNGDLWKRLDAATQRHEIEWNWVRGHAGVRDNERADQLCAAEIERLIRTSTPAQRRAALDAEARRQWEESGRFEGLEKPVPRKAGDMFVDPDRDE